MNQQSALITALAAKPFLILTGNSGTGKTKLAELFAEWLSGSAHDRYALVPVGADWTDSRDVLGFVNYLRIAKVENAEAGGTGETARAVPIYQSTTILDIVLRAANDQDNPYFLILDEMNLSHVERYFADFLSAMESREGLLHLHREGSALPRHSDGLADVPESLEIPRNLFVIGTVNVDETTYMFSPKVLDRANVIEFRVSADAVSSFLDDGAGPIGAIQAAPPGRAAEFWEISKRARGIGAALPLALFVEPNNSGQAAFTSCKETIKDLSSIMRERHQEFAYRSIAEMLRFLALDFELTPTGVEWDWRSAMDAQIIQKVLPKLHGSKRKIGTLLIALAKYCESGDKVAALSVVNSEAQVDTYPASPATRFVGARYSLSHRKLCEMIEVVRRDQFVSFIQ